MSVLDDVELAFVTGKGGVGKSTVALAAALAAARDGRRVVLCEVAGQARAARALRRRRRRRRARGAARGRAVGDDDRPGAWRSRSGPGARSARGGSSGCSRTRNAFAAFVNAAPGRARAGGDHQGVGARAARALGQGHAAATTSSSSTARRAATASACCARRTRSPRSRASGRSPRRRARWRRCWRTRRAARSSPWRSRPSCRSPRRSTSSSAWPARSGARSTPWSSTACCRGASARPTSSACSRATAQVPGPVAAAARRQHGQASTQQGQLRRLRRHTGAHVTTLPYVAAPHLGLDEVRVLADELARRR